MATRRDGLLALGGKLALADLAYSPAQVISASAADPGDLAVEHGGVYFLIWNDSVVYVGKGSPIWPRLNAHYREGRPHHRVATIAGLLKQAAAAVEDCYARAWSPPWNQAVTGGTARGMAELHTRLVEMGRDGVAPEYPVRGGAELSFMKAWQLHVLGYRQAVESSRQY